MVEFFWRTAKDRNWRRMSRMSVFSAFPFGCSVAPSTSCLSVAPALPLFAIKLLIFSISWIFFELKSKLLSDWMDYTESLRTSYPCNFKMFSLMVSMLISLEKLPLRLSFIAWGFSNGFLPPYGTLRYSFLSWIWINSVIDSSSSLSLKSIRKILVYILDLLLASCPNSGEILLETSLPMRYVAP